MGANDATPNAGTTEPQQEPSLRFLEEICKRMKDPYAGVPRGERKFLFFTFQNVFSG